MRLNRFAGRKAQERAWKLSIIRVPIPLPSKVELSPDEQHLIALARRLGIRRAIAAVAHQVYAPPEPD